MRKLALAPPVRSLTRHMRRGLASVFLLHRVAQPQFGISGHEEQELRRTLQFLRKSNFNFVSVADIAEALNGRCELQGDAVAFTADDGFYDQAEIMAPIFLEYDIPLSIFLITGFVDGNLWPWDAKVSHIFLTTKRRSATIDVAGTPLTYSLETAEKTAWSRRHCLELCKVLDTEERNALIDTLAAAAEIDLTTQPPAGFRPMTWAQARDLERRGVRFGSHTASHEILSDLDARPARDELHDSLARLKAELSEPLPLLCWPFGRTLNFGEREIRVAKECGYLGAFSAIEGYASVRSVHGSQADPYRLNRFALPTAIDQLVRQATGLECTIGLLSRSIRLGRRAESPGSDDNDVRTFSLGQVREAVATLIGRIRLAAGEYRSLRRIDFARVRRLVFACKGNICRSPYAEAQARRLGIAAISVGTEAIVGAPADANAIRLSAERGLSLAAHRSRPLRSLELKDSDLVVAMEPEHVSMLRQYCDVAGAQLTLLGIWGTPAILSIPDPYGRPDACFLKAFGLIEGSMGALYRRLNRIRSAEASLLM
jgi:protein-tyrosine-phosphatase/peptidoglycan/xylan/chitin deacetylase (PgdA/CDA1 family)